MKKLIQNQKQRFAAMPTKQKDTLIKLCVVVALVAAALLGYMAQGGSGPSVKTPTSTKNTNFKLPRPDMAKEVWVEGGQREIEQLRREQRALEQRLKSLETKAPVDGGGTSALPSGGGAPGSLPEREAKLRNDLLRAGITPVEKGGDLYPPSPVKPAVVGEVKKVTPLTSDELGISRVPVAPGQPGQPTTPAAPMSSLQARNIMGVVDFTAKKVDVVAAKAPDPKTIGKDGTNYAETDNFYTPSGSFFKVSLLTGLDAPSGPSAQAKPHPLLLRIQDLSWLPNELRQNVTGCFVLCEGYGDLSTERAYLRGLNLSCVNKENKNVLDEQIVGYMADVDGKLGMRGRVVSKQGQYLARALMASFIEGVAKGFDSSANTTVVTSGGVVTTNEIDGFGDGFKKGASSGFSKAASKMSDFYLKSAEQLYPIIEVNALRHGTFTITEGKRFSFNKQIMIEQKKAALKGKNNEDL